MGEALRSCLHCGCLGETIFGKDVDHVFAYQTPKVVSIRDRTLGIVKHLLTLAIFCYICIFQIWYKGEHFELSSVEGTARLQWQQPTWKGCNPSDVQCMSNYTPVTDLPYCTQFAGDEPASAREHCTYFDAFELPVLMPQGVLMPTFIEMYRQRLDCPHDAVDCQSKYRYVNAKGQLQNGTGEARPTNKAYVADVEDFTLMIDHSFRSVNGRMADNALHMDGNFQVCNRDRTECSTSPIRCAHAGCRGADDDIFALARGARAAARPSPAARSKLGLLRRERSSARRLALREAEQESLDESAALESAALAAASAARAPMVYSIKSGDVFSLRTLLSMAGRSLEDPVGDSSLRNRGGALVIHIKYHNLARWVLFSPEDPADYTISATVRPMDKFKYRYVHKEEHNGRWLRTLYGQYIVVEQSGQIAFFDLGHSLLIMTTALGLLVVANTLTDMLALYVLPRKASYYHCKYEETVDFSDATPGKEASSAKADDTTGGSRSL